MKAAAVRRQTMERDSLPPSPLTHEIQRWEKFLKGIEIWTASECSGSQPVKRASFSLNGIPLGVLRFLKA